MMKYINSMSLKMLNSLKSIIFKNTLNEITVMCVTLTAFVIIWVDVFPAINVYCPSQSWGSFVFTSAPIAYILGFILYGIIALRTQIHTSMTRSWENELNMDDPVSTKYVISLYLVVILMMSFLSTKYAAQSNMDEFNQLLQQYSKTNKTIYKEKNDDNDVYYIQFTDKILKLNKNHWRLNTENISNNENVYLNIFSENISARQIINGRKRIKPKGNTSQKYYYVHMANEKNDIIGKMIIKDNELREWEDSLDEIIICLISHGAVKENFASKISLYKQNDIFEFLAGYQNE